MKTKLGPDSSIREIFDEISPETGMRVVPTSIPAEEGKSNLAILIAGDSMDADFLFSQFMTMIGNLHDLAKQAEAEESDEHSIIVP